MGVAVLVYVINFITSKKQISEVTKMVLSAFNVDAKKDISEQLANDAMTLTSAAFKTVKEIGSTIISSEEKKNDDKKESKK